MRIAIIGGGVSGMAAAWFLQQDHEVTLFEREGHLGGHVLTVPVDVDGHRVYSETGTRFFFDASYPHFLALLRLLGLRLTWCNTQIAFVNRARGHTVVLPPRSLRQIASILRSPRMLRHILSLNRLAGEAHAVSREGDFAPTLQEYLAQNDYPASFGPEFIHPFFSACWGVPLRDIPHFPAYSLLKTARRSPGRKGGTYEIEGGMSAYARAFGRELGRVDIRLGAGVRHIGHDGGFHIEDGLGHAQRFDQIVIATSSRDAVTLLSGLRPAEDLVAVLRRFRHFETDIVIHGDPSFMPPRRADWSLVNLFDEGDHAWMTDWSGWRHGLFVFRTWMPPDRALPSPLYRRRRFHHLLMTPDNVNLQRAIAGLQGRAGIWVAGMYTVDVDNHESALLSAIPPARALAPASPSLRRLLDEVQAARAGSPIT